MHQQNVLGPELLRHPTSLPPPRQAEIAGGSGRIANHSFFAGPSSALGGGLAGTLRHRAQTETGELRLK